MCNLCKGGHHQLLCEHVGQVDRGVRVDEADRGGRVDDLDRGGRVDQVDRGDHSREVDRGGRVDDVDRGGRVDQVDRGGRVDQVDRGGRVHYHIVSATALIHRTARPSISAMSSLLGNSPKCVQLAVIWFRSHVAAPHMQCLFSR